jgi:SAM-dependent methyltransferase
MMEPLTRLWQLASLIGREQRDKAFGKRFKPPNRPWMRYREIDVIREVLLKLRPKSCLEWGAGRSTLYFPSMLPPGASWIAIEHDSEWAQAIREAQSAPHVEVHAVAPNQFPWTDKERDGGRQDLRDYVEFARRFAPYDFILVDGRARVSCIEEAFDLLRPRGVVLLHDANRLHYHRAFGPYANQFRLQGHRGKDGGIWLASKEADINEYLDTDRHEKLWKWCRRVGRVVKC